LLAASGVSVVVHYNSKEEAAAAVVEEIRKNGGTATAVRADLSDTSSVESLVEKSRREFGDPDILVNNAGYMTRASLMELTDELWDQSMDLHLKSVYRLIKAVVPSMMEQKWGRIINISSQSVYVGSNKHSHYVAAKSGLHGFTYSLVKELGSYGITVNLVSPGRIVTDLLRPHIPTRKDEWLKMTPLGRFGEPEEVAAAIVFLASGEASYITGTNIHVNGGIVMD
jgi:3-oxoacyl-[acyl-carrier protein] reductase